MMGTMRARMAILLSLLVIGGLLSSVQPAQAGPWVVKVHLSCTMKQSPGGQQLLFFPIAGLPTTVTTTYAISCGKGKPPKHFITPVPLQQEFCQLDQLAPNGKKPTKTKPMPNANGTKKSNCNVKANAVVFAGSNCGSSSGEVKGTITNKDGKVVTFDATWISEIGGFLRLIGTTRPPKPGIFVAGLQLFADIQKGKSCTTGTDAFKLVGTATAEGVKAK
jgi:hypothetical protein